MKIEITPTELRILRSVVEMTNDGSGCTFRDWLETNPEHTAAVGALSDKLRALDDGDLSKGQS